MTEFTAIIYRFPRRPPSDGIAWVIAAVSIVVLSALCGLGAQ